MDLIEKNYNIQERLAEYFSKELSKEIEIEHIFNALLILLGDKEGIEHPANVWDITIEYAEALNLLKSFDFSILEKEIATNFIIPKEKLFNTKVQVKSKNLIWVIHAYDADPFPSRPHAHELNQNIKLDLSNGNCYRVRKLVSQLKKKDLIELRSKIEKVYNGKLPDINLS